MSATMMDCQLTLDWIADRAERYMGRAEIVSRRPDKSLTRTTYAQVIARARRLARGLVAAGMRRGDRVATLMWNHAEHLEAYFGIARVDEHGFMQLTDRMADLIKSGGEWIASQELENALMGHPAVREAAVIGVPHPRWCERPLAAVVLKDGQTVSADQLRDFLAPRFAKFWLPDAFVFVDAIPRTSAGKFKKTELRDRYRNWQW